MSHRSPRVKTVAHDGHPRTRVRSSGFQTDSKASGPLVLLVEDYKDTRDMYAQFLRYSGFRVEEAQDGIEAIEKAAEFSPDIILMDLALPRMDGWEATRQLKASRVTSGIPIVALTGHALAAHEERARRAGCDAFIAKPCTPDSVVDAIHRILRH